MYSRRSIQSLALIAVVFCTYGVWHACAQVQPAREPEIWLYLEPFEVRREILIPVRALETLLPMPRNDPAVISTEDQAAWSESISTLLEALNPVRMDGLEVRPETSRVSWLDGRAITVLPEDGPVPLQADSALVGLISTFSTKGALAHLELSCDLFTGVTDSLRCTGWRGEDSRRKILTREDNVFRWSESVGPELPAFSEVPPPERKGWFGGRSISVTEEHADRVFTPLLRNIYRAFDYREEEAVYDALSRSVSGDLLAELYLTLRQTLQLESEGGPVTRVRNVQLMKGEVVPDPGLDYGFRYEAVWAVTGSVEHWGHVHQRKNQYRGLFIVRRISEEWKMTGFEVLDQRRVETWTRPRDSTALSPETP